MEQRNTKSTMVGLLALADGEPGDLSADELPPEPAALGVAIDNAMISN